MSKPEYLSLIYLHHTAHSPAVDRSLQFFSENHQTLTSEINSITQLDSDVRQIYIGAADRMMIPWADRSVHFGDGIYEVCRVDGGSYKFFDRHMTRLLRSFDKMGFAKNPANLLEAIKSWSIFLLEKSQVKSEAILYIQISRCVSEKRNHLPNGKSANYPSVYMQLIHMPHLKPELFSQGTTAHLVPDNRHTFCDIKTVNLLANFMGVRSAAESQDPFTLECLMYRTPYSIDIPLNIPEKELALQGIITEASSSAVMAVFNGELWTHPESRMVLPSITRRLVIELATKAGYTVREERFTVKKMISEASELFIMSTVKGVLPVVRCLWMEFGQEEIVIGDGKPGPVGKELHALWKNE